LRSAAASRTVAFPAENVRNVNKPQLQRVHRMAKLPLGLRLIRSVFPYTKDGAMSKDAGGSIIPHPGSAV
jgi:hypothetical protein